MSTRSVKNERRSRSRSPVKSKVKSKRLLVSNIPFNVTLKELKEIFKEKIGICGKLDFIDINGKFSGNAIMEFKTLDGAQKAVSEMHKHSVNGREIIVREETNKDRDRLHIGPPQTAQSMLQSQDSLYQLIRDLQRDGPVTNSLFIANLDYSLTWQKLKDMFKSAGRVRHVDLKTDADGKSRGFGTVEFETPEEAVMAIHMFHDKKINSREIKLRMDKSGKAASGELDMSRFTSFDSPNQNGNLSPQIRRVLEDILASITNPNRSNPQAVRALNELLSIAQMMDKNQYSDNYSSIKGNFDRNPSRSWNDIVQSNVGSDMFFNQSFDNPYYRDRGGLMEPKMPSSYHDYPSRIGRDYPDSPRDMRYNLGSQSSPMSGNREMLLIEDILHKLKGSSNNFDQLGVLNALSSVFNNNHNSTGNSTNSKRFDEPFTSGVNPSRLSGGGDYLPNNSSNTLLIKNIPFSYTWKDLKHSFSQAPGIVHTEIVRDEFNRSKGIGLVRFESHGDAVRCKNMMDGTLFDGRPIHIDFSNMLK